MAFTYFLNFFSKLSSSSEEEAYLLFLEKIHHLLQIISDEEPLPGYLLEIKARFLQKSGPSSDNFRRLE